jgi:2-hydroxy-3-oxopropionate reductase
VNFMENESIERVNGRLRVGFVGLGLMGAPMAGNLARAGYEMNVFTRTMSRAKALIDAGAHACSSAAHVAAASDVVITMLPDSPDVVDVICGADGVLQGARPALAWIDMSTISPGVTRMLCERCQEAGMVCLDAPVSGGTAAAAEGSLAIMVGGAPDAFEQWLPLLSVLGQRVIRIGDNGSGQVAKACNQMVIAATLGGVAESLVLAQSAGVDPRLVREALLGGFAASRVLEVHGQRMLDRAFEPGFFIRLHRKDLHVALELARETNTAVPYTSLGAQAFNALVGSGDGELDHSAIVMVFERLGAHST